MTDSSTADDCAVAAHGRSRAADAAVAVLLPVSSALGGGALGGAVFAGFTLAGAEPPAVAIVAAALCGAGLVVAAASSAIRPAIPLVRRLLAVAAGIAALTVAGSLIPFVMVDDKPWPPTPRDVVEEALLLAGTYGAMFLAAFTVLRWPWIEHLRLGRRTSRCS